MAKLRVHNFSISLDGYGAGPDQALENPLGVDGERLHEWLLDTPFGREMMGQEGGEEGIDQDFALAGVDGVGATIMGRNMFGPVRGEWGDTDWRGWWGDDPPYHHPVFVLTHHARQPIEMDGGTTFYFVTDGIESALERATEAASGADIRGWRRGHRTAVPARGPRRRVARPGGTRAPRRGGAALRRRRSRRGVLARGRPLVAARRTHALAALSDASRARKRKNSEHGLRSVAYRRARGVTRAASGRSDDQQRTRRVAQTSSPR